MTEVFEFELWGLPATLREDTRERSAYAGRKFALLDVGGYTIESEYVYCPPLSIKDHLKNLSRLLSEKGILVIHERNGRMESEQYAQFPYSYAHYYGGSYVIHRAHSKNSHFETAEELVAHLSKKNISFKVKLD